MSAGHSGNSNVRRASHRGLLKLMVKLPSIRGHLQMIAARQTSLLDLCEAYDEATAMLDRLERGQAEDFGGLLQEYRTLCSEIETDVIQYCLQHK